MAEYSITISIPDERVAYFNSKGFKLCVASGVESDGDINYNVVSWSSTIAHEVNVTWTEQYMIAASRDSFSGGKKFTASTSQQNIAFGQSYTLPADWTNSVPNTDPKAPKAGFLFINKTPAASAVIYKKMNGAFAPVYISAAGPLPPGKESLTPRTTTAIWFQKATDTGTMISDYSTDPIYVEFVSTTTHSVSYSKDGTWAVTK